MEDKLNRLPKDDLHRIAKEMRVSFSMEMDNYELIESIEDALSEEKDSINSELNPTLLAKLHRFDLSANINIIANPREYKLLEYKLLKSNISDICPYKIGLIQRDNNWGLVYWRITKRIKSINSLESFFIRINYKQEFHDTWQYHETEIDIADNYNFINFPNTGTYYVDLIKSDGNESIKLASSGIVQADRSEVNSFRISNSQKELLKMSGFDF